MKIHLLDCKEFARSRSGFTIRKIPAEFNVRSHSAARSGFACRPLLFNRRSQQAFSGFGERRVALTTLVVGESEFKKTPHSCCTRSLSSTKTCLPPLCTARVFRRRCLNDHRNCFYRFCRKKRWNSVTVHAPGLAHFSGEKRAGLKPREP